MIIRLLHYLHRSVGDIPLKLTRLVQRIRDHFHPTFELHFVADDGSTYFHMWDTLLREEIQHRAAEIFQLTENILAHRFHALGSSPLPLSSQSQLPILSFCRGPNAHYCAAIRQQITECYSSIDWHSDFKSGFSWNPHTWYRSITYGRQPGVDIKVPWELARSQHMVLLAYAYVAARDQTPRCKDPEIYVTEFKNQVLDFIATNPPRFGVNWFCTMDVGIRVANWLIAFDLFAEAGYSFDVEFRRIFLRSIYEHGYHCLHNLEYSARLTTNHYLANIVGLMFVSTHLPSTPEVTSWLAFSIQELESEIRRQFNADGSNFEASTAYHRLSTEMLIYAASLLQSLPQEKRDALDSYDHLEWKSYPKLRARSAQLFNPKTDLILSQEFWQRLKGAIGFSGAVTGLQIGDNDSGRFVKFDPRFHLHASTVEESEQIHLNQSHISAAGEALFAPQSSLTHRQYFDYSITYSLLQANRNFPLQAIENLPTNGKNLSADTSQSIFQDFGLVIFRRPEIFLAIRSGNVGQRGNGGHAHNDCLSITLAIRGAPFITDPGTMCYTSDITLRNKFRSTYAHSTLCVKDKEQNSLRQSLGELFTLRDRSLAKLVSISPDNFIGEHLGFGTVCRRAIAIHSNSLTISDFLDCPLPKWINIILHPTTKIVSTSVGSISVACKGIQAVISYASSVQATVEDAIYSPGYGIVFPTQKISIPMPHSSLEWSVSWK